MIRTSRLMLLLVAAPFALGACKKKPPVTENPPVVAPPSNPTPPSTNTNVPPAVTPRDTMADHMARVAATREMMLKTIYFGYDSDELTDEARATLDSRLPAFNANPNVRIRIAGHCDERGTDEYNLVLGRRRAEKAKQYLVDRGIDASRIETISFGRERPAVQGSDESAWSQNRRDEFEFTAGGESLRPVAR